MDELEPEHEDPDPHDIEPKDLDVGEGRQEIVTAEQQHDGGEDALARLIEGEADELQCRGIRQGKARAGEAIDLGGDDAGTAGGEAHEEDAGGFDAHEVPKAHGGIMVDHDDGGVCEDTEDVIAQKAGDARDDPLGVDAYECTDEVVELAAQDEVGGVGDSEEREEDERGAHLLHGGAVGFAVLDGRGVTYGDLGGTPIASRLDGPGCPGCRWALLFAIDVRRHALPPWCILRRVVAAVYTVYPSTAVRPRACPDAQDGYALR